MKTDYQMEEVLPILSELVKSYTSNESTSVTYETAQMIMESILYCIQEGRAFSKTAVYTPNERIEAKAAYEYGLRLAKEKLEKAKTLFKNIEQEFHSYHNECYQDTVIKGMPAFFNWYDIRFDATNHILTLDYPLLIPIEHMQGIDLIYEYLARIHREQLFLNNFDEQQVQRLLYDYSKDNEELIFNISQLIIDQLLANLLLGKPNRISGIDDIERQQLTIISKTMAKEEMCDILTKKLKCFIKNSNHNTKNKNKEITLGEDKIKEITLGEDNNKDIENEDIKDKHIKKLLEKEIDIKYLISYIPVFVSGFITVANASHLNQMFPKQRKEKPKRDKRYIDGAQMKDENLRELIHEMKECRYTSDKLSMLQESIKSLADLKEVLSECFWTEEYKEVFSLLSPAEKEILLHHIKRKWKNEEELREWEQLLPQYLRDTPFKQTSK